MADATELIVCLSTLKADMKILVGLFLALSCFILTQSFQCNRYTNPACDTFKTDSVLLKVGVLNPAVQFHLYDTIWLNSTVNDVFNPLSGTPASFTKQVDQLGLSVQPYSINISGTLPSLLYANIEFNPVVKDGSLQTASYNGYNYIYRRIAPDNKLTAGLVPGRTGLFLIELNNNNYYGVYINNPTDNCSQYYTVINVPAAQQNVSYWGSLGVTTISMAQGYGSHTVSQSMHNYIIVKIVP